MDVFGMRGRAVQRMRALVEEHLHWVEETLSAMAQTVESYLGGEKWETLEERAVEVHRRESKADDARQVAEAELVRGMLLAGTRRSLLNILDALDLVANNAEAAVDFLVYQRVLVPESLHPLVRNFLSELQEEWKLLRAAVEAFLAGQAEETVRLCKEVDQRESFLDEIHRRSIIRLFGLEISLAEKIQARDFINRLEDCANVMEDVSDLLTVAVAASIPI